MTSQIDAHKAENERRERRKKGEARVAQDEDMEDVLVEEADITEEGYRLRLERKVVRSQFPTASREEKRFSPRWAPQNNQAPDHSVFS